MNNNKNNKEFEIFSKDNPVIEIASKEIKTQVRNIIPPVKPKEHKKD